jgi:hypothetical protein
MAVHRPEIEKAARAGGRIAASRLATRNQYTIGRTPTSPCRHIAAEKRRPPEPFAR